MSKAPAAEEKEKRLEEALAAFRAKVAQIPRKELLKVSPNWRL